MIWEKRKELLASPVLAGSPHWDGEAQRDRMQCPGSSEELSGSPMPAPVWAQPRRSNGRGLQTTVTV